MNDTYILSKLTGIATEEAEKEIEMAIETFVNPAKKRIRTIYQSNPLYTSAPNIVFYRPSGMN